MAAAAQQHDFHEQGFVTVPGFLPADQLEELKSHLHRYVKHIVPNLPPGDAFYQKPGHPETLSQLHRMAQDDWFRSMMHNPRWSSLATELLGEPVTADEPEWFNKPPGTRHITPPHQDNFYFCLTPPVVLTIWVALDAVDAETGCLRYVAGSHRHGFRPHGRSRIVGFSQGITDYSHEDFAREIAVPLQPGDAVVHHGMTIHRADANLSPSRHRRSFAMVFRGASCQRDQPAWERYLASSRSQQQENAQQQEQAQKVTA